MAGCWLGWLLFLASARPAVGAVSAVASAASEAQGLTTSPGQGWTRVLLGRHCLITFACEAGHDAFARSVYRCLGLEKSAGCVFDCFDSCSCYAVAHSFPRRRKHTTTHVAKGCLMLLGFMVPGRLCPSIMSITLPLWSMVPRLATGPTLSVATFSHGHYWHSCRAFGICNATPC